jgi:hypothetical protein
MSTPRPPHTTPTPHLDLDTLADLQEGLLEPERATDAAAHLQDCPDCRTTRAALDDVSAQLRDLGAADQAVPEDVVRRLDDALVAVGTPTPAATATITPLRRPERAPWRTRALQAAAVFVLIAAVGGIGYGAVRGLSNGDSASSTAASDSSGGAKAASPESQRGAAGYKIMASGRDYTGTSLRAAVPELLAGSLPLVGASGPTSSDSSAPPSSSAAPGTAGTGNQRLRSGAALAACVANLAGGPVTPLAVDVAKFKGQPATVIVLPTPDEPSFVDVFVVKPTCPTGTFLTLERVALP